MDYRGYDRQDTFLPELNLPDLVLKPADFLRSYEEAKDMEGATRAVRLEHLKKARIHTIEEEEYHAALKKLENVASFPRFVKQYMDLKPLVTLGGLLEQGEAHYFNVPLRGYPSPLGIELSIQKGTVACYFSYHSIRPGPDIYDFRFRTKTFKIYGRYTVFKEPKGVLCVLAETDAYVRVRVTFGDLGEPLVTKSFCVREDDQVQKRPKRKMPTLPVDFTVKNRSVSPENLSQSVNFIEVNKRKLIRTRSHTRSLNLQRHLQVKERHQELCEAQKAHAISIAARLQRRQEAQVQAHFIAQVLMRKRLFECGWLTFITFAAYSQFLNFRYNAHKLSTLRRLKESFNCKIVQRAYRRQYPPDFDIKTRTMVLLSAHIRFYLAINRHSTRKITFIPLFNCIRDGYHNKKVHLAINMTFNRITKIQRNFRLQKYMEKYYFRIIYELWEKVVREEEEKYMKSKANRRFLHLPENEKLNIIQIALQESKARHREFHKDGMRRARHLFSFLPTPEELLDVIVRSTKRKGLARRLARKSRLSILGTL